MTGQRRCRGGRRLGFSIDFANVRGLKANHESVEYHLANSIPNILLLSETQLARDSFSNKLNISNYNIFYNFRLNGGVCAYININTPVTRLENLESPNFDVLWLKIFLPTTTIILCFCYCSLMEQIFRFFLDISSLLTRLSLLIQLPKSFTYGTSTYT